MKGVWVQWGLWSKGQNPADLPPQSPHKHACVLPPSPQHRGWEPGGTHWLPQLQRSQERTGSSRNAPGRPGTRELPAAWLISARNQRLCWRRREGWPLGLLASATPPPQLVSLREADFLSWCSGTRSARECVSPVVLLETNFPGMRERPPASLSL